MIDILHVRVLRAKLTLSELIIITDDENIDFALLIDASFHLFHPYIVRTKDFQIICNFLLNN